MQQEEVKKLWLDPFLDKWKPFGWDSQEIDGHDF